MLKLRNLLIILSLSALVLVSCGKKKVHKHEQVKDNSIDLSLNQTNFGTRNLSAIDLYSTKRVGEFTVSPDGQWIVYKLSSPSIAMNKLISNLIAMKIDGSETIQLTNDIPADMNPAFSPDGKKFAFISARDKNPQIYVMDFPKGTPKKVTNFEKGVGGFHWSPDGKNFLVCSEVKVDSSLNDKYPDYKKANMMIYNDLPIRHWDEWNDEYMSHIYVVPVDGAKGKEKDLMEKEAFESPLKPFGGAEEFAWSPESNEVAYTCKKGPHYENNTNSDIYVVNLKDGTTKNITQGMDGYDKVPKYSPDGKWIAFTSQERPGFESDKIRLMLYERATGKITDLSKTCDQWVEEYTWAPDSKSIYYVANDTGTVQLYHIDLTGNWKIITHGFHSIGGGLEITNDGKTLVFGKQTFTEPLEIFTMPALGGDMKRITNTNEELYKNIKMPTFKERWITSTDKKKVQCWMIYPPDFDSTKKYPMITYLQGGPQSMIGPNYHYRWNLAWMASNGYIVLAANRRGVPGFGQAWNDAISKDWGGMPMTDLLAATDELSKEPYVNVDARAALGASAGGYAAYWLAGHHQKRFKAFIAHAGVFDLISMYGATEELFFPNWEYGGPYWEAKSRPNFEQNSPHNFVKNWDTPIMISVGMNDFRVPYTQGLEAYTAARAQGIPAEIVIFPEETHFISHPQEFIIWSKEFMKFLDKYCKK